MKKFFKWLLLTVAVLATGVAVLLYNPALVKGPLERQLGKLIGHPLSFRGDIVIDVGTTMELSLTDVHIAAPDWSGNPDLAVIGQLQLELHTASVFAGTILIDALRINSVTINLETHEKGEKNWVSRAQAKQRKVVNESRPAVLFRDIELHGATLSHVDRKRDLRRLININTLTQQYRPDDMLAVVIDGGFNNQAIGFDGIVGPYANLLQGQEVSFRGRGEFGNAIFNGQGLIDDLVQPRRPEFDLDLKGPDIDRLTTTMGWDDLGTGGFSLRLRGGVVQDHFEAGISGEIGDFSLNLSLLTDTLSNLDELELELAASGPDLGAVTSVIGLDHWPHERFNIRGEARRVGHTLDISTLRLDIGGAQMVLDALLSNFPALDTSRINLNITGDDIAPFRDLLGLRGAANGEFSILGRLDISPDGDELIQVDMHTPWGKMALSGVLGDTPDYNDSRFNLRLEGDDAHRLMSEFDIDLLPSKPYNADARIVTTENGLVVERGALVTIGDEQLGINGFVAFGSGSKGTDIELAYTGQHLDAVLHRLVGPGVADLPFHVSGRLRVDDEGIRFEDFKGHFADVELTTVGMINLQDKDAGDEFDFSIQGGDFAAIGNVIDSGFSKDIFVPGQAYRVDGMFSLSDQGWELGDVHARVGTTNIDFSGFFKKQPEVPEGRFRFSLQGPDLQGFLLHGDLPAGRFESAGQVDYKTDSLIISDLSIATPIIKGDLDIELLLPFGDRLAGDFDINLRGEDIRYLVPSIDWFEPTQAAYSIAVAGNKRDDDVSLQRFILKSDEFEISALGGIETGAVENGNNLVVSVTVDDLSALGLLNEKALPRMPLNLDAELKGSARQFRLQDINGSLGDGDFNGYLDVSGQDGKPLVDVKLDSRSFDISPFLEMFRQDNDVAAKGGESDQARLIPATPLPLDVLNTVDMTVTLQVDEVRFNDRSGALKLDVEASLHDGHLAVTRLSSEGAPGQVNATFSVTTDSSRTADVEIDLNLHQFVYNFTGQSGDKLQQSPLMDAHLYATAKGGNLRELAGSMNGFLRAGSDGGTLEGVSLSMLDKLLIEQVVTLIMPKSKSSASIQLNCVAAFLSIDDGLVRTDPALAYASDRISLVSEGTLDLKTEKLDLSYNATPHSMFRISPGEVFNPYIRVTGTLANPVVGLDPSKALLHGGAAVGTGGLSILFKGVMDRVDSTSQVCQQMLGQMRQPN